MLKQSKRDRKKKNKYYMSVLNAEGSGNQQSKSQSNLAKTGQKSSKTIETNKESDAKGDQNTSIIGEKTSRVKSLSALDKRLLEKGATREKIDRIN